MSSESPRMSTVLVDLNSHSDDMDSLVEEYLEKLQDNNPYQEDRVIGEGGMGSVSLVQDKRLLRQVALKYIHPDKISFESLLRFIKEAQITAKLEHPNIIPVYGLGDNSKKEIFYSMKFVEGENLKKILNDLKNNKEEVVSQFPLSRLLDIFLAICDAVSYACSRGIVHRDLKPDNIMIGDHGKVYLVDWGLAKDLSYNNEVKGVKSDGDLKEKKSISEYNNNPNLTLNGTFIGTPHYMAPERFMDTADEQTEVFALGSILYNILTLKPIVKTSDIPEIVKIISSDGIEPPESVKVNSRHLPLGKVPSPLSSITMKALAPCREDRYQSVKHLISEIKAWQNGLLTEAEEADIFTVSLKLFRRYKKETFSILFFLAVSVLLLVYYMKNVNDQKNRFQESELQSKLNTEKINQSSSLYEKSSIAVSQKIEEVQKLAPEFHENAVNALRRLDVDTALKQIETALSLKEESEYLYLKAYALFLKEDLSKSADVFNGIIERFSAQKEAEEALALLRDLDKREIKLNNIQLMSNHVAQYRPKILKPFQTQNVQKSLLLKDTFLKSIKGTDLDFINSSMIKVLKSGNLALALKNTNLSNLETLRGLPVEELDISNNPIQDLSPLKGMPLKILYISNIKTNDLSPLAGMPLEIFHCENNGVEDISPLVNMPLIGVKMINNKIKSIPNLQWNKVEGVDFSKNPLEDIYFLKHMPGLKLLRLIETQVKDLSHISKLKIEALDLSSSRITDLLPLKNLPLKSISIAGNRISDLSPLSESSLNKLLMSNTNIEDLSPISNLPLTGLDLRGTKVSDLSPIKDMPLKILYLDNSQVRDISPLKNMKLEELRLHPASINLETLRHIKSLTSLQMNNFQGEKLPDLSGLKLKALTLKYSKVKDISGIKDCNIWGLDLTGTGIRDFSPLSNRTFEKLILQDCGLTDISFLSSTDSNVLNLSHNRITDLAPIRGMNLVHLNLKSTDINNINPISQSPLVFLDISDTKVKDLTPLEGMPINHLVARNTPLFDLTPVKQCKRMRTLDLSHTQIDNIEPLKKLPIAQLLLENCDNLNNLKSLNSMGYLYKLVVPAHIKDLSYLRNPKLKFIGTKMSEAEQPAHIFWHSRRKLE